MAIQSVGYGSSTASDTPTAVQEAVSQALEGLGETSSSPPIMAFCSATVHRDITQVRQALAQALPPSTLIHGLTSSGAILKPGTGALPAAVACLLLSTNNVNDFVSVFNAQGNAVEAAADLHAKLATTTEPPQAIFMSTTPGAEEGTLQALEAAFPGIPVFGGTAADNELSGAWNVWSAETVSSTGIALVAIGSNVAFGASMMGPYTPTSQTCIATKTDGQRRVYEINNAPAVDWVRDWLGEAVQEQYESGGLVLPQTAQKPIAVQGPNQAEAITAHCAAFSGLQPAEGDRTYVNFFAPIPQGSTLTVMDSGNGPETGYATALTAAYDTAQTQLSSSSSPKAGMLIYCGGMAIAVGDNLNTGLTNNELSSKVGTVPILGMACFGEQACLEPSKRNVQRNLSVGMILFG